MNKKQPTIHMVAKKAGFAVGTISRVLNGHANVDPAIKRKVEAVMHELGYEPNLLARGLRKQKGTLIGCVIRDVSIPALSHFVKSAQDALFDADLAFVVGNSNGDARLEQRLVHHFTRTQAQGLILSLTSERNLDYMQDLQQRGLPVVLLDREGPDWADKVLADHAVGTRDAVTYLIGLGHRKIALITGDSQTYPGRARMRGYMSAFELAKIPADSNLIRHQSYLAEYAMSELSELLNSRTRPTAVIAGGINMLPGVLKAVRSVGASIPKDISVVAVSDDDLTRFSHPAIAVVRWDLAEVGRIAAHMLVKRILDRSVEMPPQTLRVPTEFVPRGSCSAPGEE